MYAELREIFAVAHASFTRGSCLSAPSSVSRHGNARWSGFALFVDIMERNVHSNVFARILAANDKNRFGTLTVIPDCVLNGSER